MKHLASLTLLLFSILLSGNVLAQDAATPPEWDKLTPQQREALIAPVRERWNREPEERARMLERAQRWQSMTPEQRKQARHGMKRFERMNPEQRRQARALYEQMTQLTPEQRDELRERWKTMTPAQRDDWMRKHAPKDAKPAPPRP
ncbi:DUF3106 domain-containing protein [Pseudoxanthomonas putridarboris]|uniref:DUF3106 domain-containing protein n=1 Tax=Pseudoxanthomonas putridarboris TaxID=752605 RepID=A0ABU9J325_9GAMM